MINYKFPLSTYLNKTNSDQPSVSSLYSNHSSHYINIPPYINTVPSYPISSYITQSFPIISSPHANLTQITCITNIHFQSSELNLSKYSISYFGFFEGQYTSLVSDYLKRHFHSLLFQDNFFLISIYDSFINTFNTIYTDINNMLLHNMQSSSYALVALFINNICYIANVGNSRCVMCTSTGDCIYQLTEFHVDDVTRLISLNKNKTVSYYPDIISFQLNVNDNFIIIANQSVFDYLTNEDIVLCVYKGIKSALNDDDVYKEVTKTIWEERLRKGNFHCSDVDVLVIFFEDFVKEYIEIDMNIRNDKIDKIIRKIEKNIRIKLYNDKMYFSFYESDNILYKETMNSKYKNIKRKKRKNLKKKNIDILTKRTTASIRDIESNKSNLNSKWYMNCIYKMCCCYGNKNKKRNIYKNNSNTNACSMEKIASSSQLELMKLN